MSRLCYEEVLWFFTVRPSDLITTLTYVLMDNFYTCFMYLLFLFVICWVWINGHAIMLMVLFLLNNVCWILLNTRKVNIILIWGISDVDERLIRKIWQGKRLCIAQPWLWGIHCVAPFFLCFLFLHFLCFLSTTFL